MPIRLSSPVRCLLITVLLAALAMGGCGGGSGSGSFVTPTDDDVHAFAAAGVAGALGFRKAGDGDSEKPAAIFGLNPERFSVWSLVQYVFRRVGQPSGSDACNGGGSVDCVFIDSDASGGPTQGDRYEFDFQACADRLILPSTVEGRVDLELLSDLTLGGGQLQLEGVVEFPSLQLTSWGVVRTLSGSLHVTVSIDASSVSTFTIIPIYPYMLTQTDPLGTLSWAFGAMTQVVQPTGAYNVAISCALSDTRWGNGLLFVTTTAGGLDGDPGQWPHQGSISLLVPVTARTPAGGQATLTAVSPTQVHVTYDDWIDVGYEVDAVVPWVFLGRMF